MPKVVSRASSLIEASSQPAAQRARGCRWPTDRFRLPVDRRTRTSGNTARTLTTSPPQCSRRQPERSSTRDRHDAPTQKPLSTRTKHSISGNPRQHEPDGKSRRCSPEPGARSPAWLVARSHRSAAYPLTLAQKTGAVHGATADTISWLPSAPRLLFRSVPAKPLAGVRARRRPWRRVGGGRVTGVARRAGRACARATRRGARPDRRRRRGPRVAAACASVRRWRARATRHQRTAVRPGVQATSST